MRLDPITLAKHASKDTCPKLKRNAIKQARLYEFVLRPKKRAAASQFMPGDHSKLAPLLPIPNRTVKRLCADDSADARVKVGHRQALIWRPAEVAGRFLFGSI